MTVNRDCRKKQLRNNGFLEMVIYLIFTEPPRPTRCTPGHGSLHATRDASDLGHQPVNYPRDTLHHVGILAQNPATKL